MGLEEGAREGSKTDRLDHSTLDGGHGFQTSSIERRSASGIFGYHPER